MKHGKFPVIVLGLVMAFLYLPIIVLVANSFNLSKYGGDWSGFTLQWYQMLFRNRDIWVAFEHSVVIAASATLVSCIIGTSAALALHRWHGKLQVAHYGLIYTPLVMPEILMGISLLMMFTAVGLPCGLITVFIAHVTFCVSYVAMTVLARLQDFDDSLVEAAYDLGASSFYAFFKVQLPILLPGIIAGGLLAFTLSIDDFVITFFVTGPGADTLPLKIYSMIKHSRQMPVINSLSTIMLAFTCLLVALSRILANLRKRHAPSRSASAIRA